MTNSGISPLTRDRMPRSDPSLLDAPPTAAVASIASGPAGFSVSRCPVLRHVPGGRDMTAVPDCAVL